MKKYFVNMLKHFAQELIDWRNKSLRGPQAEARKNLLKNFEMKASNTNKGYEDILARKTQSMMDSQGVDHFSGSAYNGPGNIDREKTHSNKLQRNF